MQTQLQVSKIRIIKTKYSKVLAWWK